MHIIGTDTIYTNTKCQTVDHTEILKTYRLVRLETNGTPRNASIVPLATNTVDRCSSYVLVRMQECSNDGSCSTRKELR